VKIKKVNMVRRIFGIILIVTGLAGLALPILPGWLMIFIGLELIGLHLVFFDRIKEYAKRKINEMKKKKGRK